MQGDTMRVVRVLAVIAAVILVIGAGYRLVKYLDGRQRYAVAVPPADASPEQVALAFLRALDAHDRRTAEKLVTPGNHVDPDGWVDDTARVTNIKILGVRLDPTYGHDSGTAYRQAYQVDVSFDYQAQWWYDSQASFPDGNHDWTYSVVWDHGRWLIQDNGQG
jgi:hypothetical protein